MSKLKTKGILKTCVALGLCAVLAVGGYHLYKHWDKVTDWFNGIFHKEDPAPDKPTQPEGEEIKDFTFSGNQITGYIGSEVVLDNLPTSYSMKVGEVEEVLEITIEDMADEDAMRELAEKVENGSFYCTPNDNERFFSSTYESWEEYMAEHYPGDEATKAFPMKFEFCSVTYFTGNDIKITKIADGAFAGNTILFKIVIPNEINDIGQQAFENCDNLTEINIPEGITEIKYQTFYGCKNLENIALPASLTSIGYGAFDLTAIKSLTIPANVSELEMIVSNEAALEELHIKSTLINPEQITSLASFASNLKIYVPDSFFLECYDYFSYYLDKIYPENGTYPEEPEEPEIVTIIFKSESGEELSSTTAKQFEEIELPTLESDEENKFVGWLLNDEIYTDYYYINEYGLSTLEFTAKFYHYPKINNISLYREYDGQHLRIESQEHAKISSQYGAYAVYSSEMTYNSKEELEADLDNLFELLKGKIQATSPAYNEGSYSLNGLVKEKINLYIPEEAEAYPYKVAAVTYSVYDLSACSQEEIDNFTQYFNTTYSEVIEASEINVFDIAEPNLLKSIEFDAIVSLDLNQFSDCVNLETIVLNSDEVVTITGSSNAKIYVPDELYEEYLLDENWQELVDQIHLMSELAEG